MPVILDSQSENGFFAYQPHDFAHYVERLAAGGMTPPRVPFRIRLPASTLASGDTQRVEEAVAAFFGLGDVSGIAYSISHS